MKHIRAQPPKVRHNQQTNYTKQKLYHFHIHTVLLDGFEFFFHSPTDAQVNCLKNNFKIYIKIDIKTATTCFGVIAIIRERIIRSC
jgi:hypothetical protein